MERTKKFRISAVLLCFILMFSLSGCKSDKEENKTENLKKVVENIFSKITDSEYEELTENPNTSSPKWLDDRFAPYMTETAYEQFLQKSANQILIRLHTSKEKIQISDFSVEEGKDGCTFVTELSMEDGSGGKDTFKLEGTAQFDENGLVRYLDFFNLDEFTKLLND